MRGSRTPQWLSFHIGKRKADEFFIRTLLCFFSRPRVRRRAHNGNLELTPVTTPASADVVNDHVSKLSITIGDATNWDQGLWQIAADPNHYDLAVVLTDGDPTRYGAAPSTRLRAAT
jgi:hypothetical protein